MSENDFAGRAPLNRLVLRSGVNRMNDQLVGDFYSLRTAQLVGALLVAIDLNSGSPEYSLGYDVMAITTPD